MSKIVWEGGEEGIKDFLIKRGWIENDEDNSLSYKITEHEKLTTFLEECGLWVLENENKYQWMTEAHLREIAEELFVKRRMGENMSAFKQGDIAFHVNLQLPEMPIRKCKIVKILNTVEYQVSFMDSGGRNTRATYNRLFPTLKEATQFLMKKLDHDLENYSI